MKNIKLYKSYLLKYLQQNSIEINHKKKPPVLRCLQPGHIDNDPSAILYSENIWCPVCNKNYDIFEVAGFLNNTKDFKEQIKAIETCLSLPSSQSSSGKKNISTPLPYEEATIFYSKSAIENKIAGKDWGKIIKVWPYRNKEGLIICVDVRFENDNGKTIINFWNNGGDLSYYNSPPALYGLFEVFQNPEKMILVNEGCKTTEAARVLTEFIPVSWNRGSNNVDYIDWAPLQNRQGFIFPDDDQAGIKAALKIQKHLPHLKIVQPIEAARKIKQKGADIVEALQVMNIAEITSHIKNAVYVPDLEIQETLVPEAFSFPFKILGVGDDNRAYFIGRHNRLIISSLDTLTQIKLQLLAPLSFWQNEFANKHKIEWADAVDAIIELAGGIDFDIENIRGRGAWREPNGEICYHDGKKTTGEKNTKRLYLQKTKKSIGLDKPAIDSKICTEISEIVKQMSFEKELDAIRCLGWSCLSPFGGALPWRPAILLTGESGTGKTTIVDYVVKKISMAETFSGAETTSAGLRQILNSDSTAIILEETDCDTPKKKQNRNDLFSLMRQATSDEAPKIVKGSKDGHAVSFLVRNMFLFVAVSPEVEAVADDNRIFRINMVEPKNSWPLLQKKLKQMVTKENCESIRSSVWQNLQKIFSKAKELTPIIQEITKKNTRTCYAESLLFSGYFTIFQSLKSIDDIKIELEKILAFEDLQKRNETEELLDRLLDESIFLSDSKTIKTLRCILQSIIKEEGSDLTQFEYKENAGRYGISVDIDGNLYIANNHHEIMKIIQKGEGYQRFFWRHPKMVDKNKAIRIAGKTRKCVMLKGIFDEDKQEYELPF